MNSEQESHWSRLKKQTVWGSTPVELDDLRIIIDIRRYVLPMYDLIIMLAAIMALRGGMPSLALLYNDMVSTVSAYVLLVAAFLCLVGVGIPKLWLLEGVSKIVLLMVMILYSGALLGLAVDNPERGFVGFVFLAACLLPAWGIYWISRPRFPRSGKING